MRPVSLNPNDVQSALREIQNASYQNDIVDVANTFSFTGTVTDTTDLDLSSPTLANVAAVLATLLQTMQKGNINRTS
jgi:hypothetical protein